MRTFTGENVSLSCSDLHVKSSKKMKILYNMLYTLGVASDDLYQKSIKIEIIFSLCSINTNTVISTHSNAWQKAEVMKGRSDPPLAEGMQ